MGNEQVRLPLSPCQLALGAVAWRGTDSGTDTDTDIVDNKYQWHTFYGGSDWDRSYSLAVDGTGNLYVTGCSDNSWDGPDGQIPLNAHSGGESREYLRYNYVYYEDIFVLKLQGFG